MALVPLKVKSNPLQNVSRADQVYAAAGVTTGDSGTTPVVQDVPVFQKALLKNRLNIRLAYHHGILWSQCRYVWLDEPRSLGLDR